MWEANDMRSITEPRYYFNDLRAQTGIDDPFNFILGLLW